MALTAGGNHRQRHFKKLATRHGRGTGRGIGGSRKNRSSAMVVHVVLLAAGGLVHAFKYSILLWPFNLVLPLLRHLPRVCATLRGAAAHYDAELLAYLGARRRAPVTPRYSVLRRLQRQPPEQLGAPAMLALVDISY